MNTRKTEVIVVGGGLAGLSCAMKLAEKGCHVKLVSVTKVRRSHSVCAQGGINIAINLKGEDDSPIIHAYDTIKGGDFLANQPSIVEMCMAGPAILRMMDRIGCPFNRTPEGHVDFRRFGGTLYHRTAFCGASTGQQLLYALDEQVRRYEAKGLVEKYEHHEFLRLVIDGEGIARGIVIHDLFNLELHVLRADAVVIATGGLGFIYKQSTNSTFCTGAANGRLYMQGMKYANGEFIQIHPTCIPGNDKMRLISESVRGEGGRIWVFGDSSKTIEFPDGSTRSCGKTGEPWYFLEEMYPAFGNLVPRDIASREVLRICEQGLGVDGKIQVFLDVTHLSSEVHTKLASVLEIYEKFTGDNPRKNPMKICPGVHYTMGGAWVDWPAIDDQDRWVRYRQMTNIPGCFNIGESDYLFHGANRLGANSLLSCIFSGLVAGQEVPRYIENLKGFSRDLPEEVFKAAQDLEEKRQKELLSKEGTENVHQLHDEMANYMVRFVSVKRDNPDLKRAIQKLKELRARYENIGMTDRGKELNQTYVFAHQFQAMLEIALVIAKGALLRNEFRGSHFKPEFPERDDQNWLKTTIATYDPSQDEPVITYEPIDMRHLDPIPRDYTTAKKGKPTLKNIRPLDSLE
ncbi:MAG: succinate dehydrogenase flavoprotein subunit [Chlamydiae bacterium RIFCSPHIGHO2_12_FULL_44_59]|nr:MAG: succinate dehydrogenase flavoprotein subunit [Chlamydiae bacterium RIFCSPHIGHO2_01_FULL_44_39]OGN61203.1 MAG: succinate dehydrogenase flavoprotein subunit [Chlamydiae bacterium RIFCSPHIGHO2_12_FULL_44_59]OGN65673.1 MAG: succinate dehydrogenase flavoprotein subunit [Chlamydiae bacterium RIFCSPLOWO2_01_FULL_44_52]OGN68150.1 MAG: succinate dehydrogenase flavoprotein subunit [Chlamydiae bacterium RIFCSPLOWO2_02_FULL_45_22]OGN69038.1 MAG: succinate dehydrogenase flavoprotein subunit [Chlamyd